MLIFLSILICTPCAHSIEDSLVEYYANLIINETTKAYTGPWPNNAYQYAPRTKNIIQYGLFDHIIIGAGSSGAVIANRLSEDNFRRVLLLEAGAHSSNFLDIPGMASYVAGTKVNWGYLSVPQNTSCFGLKDHKCPLHRGRGLGGSSLMNGLLYVRGNKRDYDNWHTQGNYGWSYTDVLHYFKKSENFLEGDPIYHGKGGYLNVEVPEPPNVDINAFFEANRLLGRNEIDYNRDEQLGFARVQLNVDQGKRESSGHAFLLPIIKRRNLDIRTESYVIKILINENKRAFGVLFSMNGKLYVAKSRRDIVISAGVIGSPQILMLSGIGPRWHLESLGIRVLQDLPVGENLHDHPSYCYLEFTTNHTEPELSLERNIRDYLNGTGNFINPFNIQTIAFLQTKYADVPEYPDVEVLMVPSISSNEVTPKFWRVQEQVVEKPYNPQNTFTMAGMLFRPKSRGYLRLKSANPFDYPIINPKMLSDEDGEDIKVLHQTIELILEMVNTPPFQKLNTKLKRVNLPECQKYNDLSQEYWYCFLRYLSVGLFHASGTCKMGTHPSNGAVVNPELKVFGITNLRVADTSIFPTPITGHNNAPAIMVGEKAADLVKGH